MMSVTGVGDIFNPTDEHAMLRETVRKFVETQVEPQAIEFNRTETFNRDLFNQCGDMGLLGITVPPEYVRCATTARLFVVGGGVVVDGAAAPPPTAAD